ncbi:uncharacterized protein LOC119673519 [Teleopsis dalmanni]|uniref:uncharacterized protein LOC119672874 n=1 Tax=Teleopsis dalmanni TaxID=139649 RepID=UPI0018CE95F0|nr:uncharacterized protein LOC119672874 [Teleopsis dalmanni]XP_037940740.1 uncharacterized protein LOC119673519 [Teleopsis dalmanni]
MARLTNIFLFQVVLIVCVIAIQAEKVMRPKFKDVKIWSDSAYVTRSVTFDANDPHINYTINVLKEIHDLDLHIEASVTQKLDSTYFFSANSTVNLCRILNWKAQSPIGNLIHAYLKEYGNLVESCPIPKGTYFIHKFWLPEDPSLAVLPEVDFELNISAHMLDANKKRTLIANDHITGEAVVQDVTNVKRGILAMLPQAG